MNYFTSIFISRYILLYVKKKKKKKDKDKQNA